MEAGWTLFSPFAKDALPCIDSHSLSPGLAW